MTTIFSAMKTKLRNRDFETLLNRISGSLNLLQYSAGIDLCEFLLCVHGKVTLHHPVIILWFCFQHITDRTAFVFSKIKDLNSIFNSKTAGHVNKYIFANCFQNRFNRIAKVGITFKLSMKNF